MLLQDIVNKIWKKKYFGKRFSGCLLSLEFKIYLEKFIPSPDM